MTPSRTKQLASKDASEEWSVLPVGTVLAHRYRIERYLASGGMGRVYRVRDLELDDAPLALKTLRSNIARHPAALRRFKQEVLLARSVTHPHVCRIFDLGRDEARDLTFLTMEYLPGETLGAHLRQHGRVEAEQALFWVRQLAEALDTAHRAGIVHRDFKSTNVMIVPDGERSRAVVTDFGLAMAIERGTPGESSPDAWHSQHTSTFDVAPGASQGPTKSPELGRMVGTPAYMSPEQVRGGPVGPASDLYALGVVLFEMRTGQLPFREMTPREVVRAHLTRDPPSPRTLAPVEEDWERIIMRLLSKEPEKRFATARDVVLALEGRFERDMWTRFHLPAEPDAFVGRTDELRALAEALEVPKGATSTRLLTLVGPGGSGKTRLATSYGWASLSRWPGGVWFCDLSEARSREGVVWAVATALGIPSGKEDPIVQLGHAIAGRGKSLIVLDNFEQVAEHAAPTLGHWVERAQETRFLVTSRERLHMPGERILEVEPLDPATQGVELFEVRAQSHRPGFRVEPSTRAQVAEIVRSLEGLPLAIELAAARLRLLSLEQLSERLRDRFQILSGGKRGRHAALRTTLDWSWDLLEPWEQTVLAQVSVFEGGFTLEAAEAVVDLREHRGERFVLDGIQSLVDKSWLRARVVRGAPRFDLYALAKEYAAERLRAGVAAGHTADAAAEIRHGRNFAKLGTADALEGLNRHGGVARLLALELEVENLMAACRRALARNDAETGVSTYRAASAVLRGREAKTCVELGREVLAHAKELADQAWVLFELGASKKLLGRMKEARDDYEAALAIFRDMGNHRVVGMVLANLGGLHKDHGRMEEAREHYEAALAIHREVGNRRSEGIVLGSLGTLHGDQGRMKEAREHHEAALAIYREMGDRSNEGIVLGNLGNGHRQQGQMEEARKHFEAALAIHREAGNRYNEGFMIRNLGYLNEAQGRMEEARKHYEEALVIHREVGDRRNEGVVLGNLGNLHRQQGRMKEALEDLESALAIHREVGNRHFEGTTLGSLGNMHGVKGQVKEARKHYEEALAIHREVGDHRNEGISLGNLGSLLELEGRLEEAREHHEAALAIHREVGNRDFEGIVLGNLGDLHAAQGRMKEAREHYEKALSILREVGDRGGMGEVLASMADLEMQEGNAGAAGALLSDAESIAADLALGPESDLARKIGNARRRAG